MPLETRLRRLIVQGLVVADPPWNREKRGTFTKKIGISSMPCHLEFVNGRSTINAAVLLSRHLNALILYRYKDAMYGCRPSSILSIKRRVLVS